MLSWCPRLRSARVACVHSQLEDDGFHGAAAMVAQTTMIRTQQSFCKHCIQPALCAYLLLLRSLSTAGKGPARQARAHWSACGTAVRPPDWYGSKFSSTRRPASPCSVSLVLLDPVLVHARARSDELTGSGNNAKALKPSDDGGRQTELDLSTPAGMAPKADLSSQPTCTEWIDVHQSLVAFFGWYVGTLPAAAYATKFITTHKAACRVAKFNSDGECTLR